MADLVKHRKEVSQLPATYEPDTLYYVRTGNGFDLYLSDHTGSIAYKINDATEVVNNLADSSTNKAASASSVKLLNETKVDKATSVVAGNGLTGGGDLSSTQTLTLGTPGQITASSTNSVSSTSHTHAIDVATTTQAGIVQLSDSVADTSTSKAATASAVKIVNDEKANKSIKLTAGNGLTGGGSLSANCTFTLGTPGQITASSTNSVSSTSHTHAIDVATTTQAGIVQLSDSVTDTSTNKAATASVVKTVNDKLDNFGGRNLLLGSDELVETNSYLLKSYNFSETLKEGELVTLTLYAKLNNRQWFDIYNSGAMPVNYLGRLVEVDTNKYQLTYRHKVGGSPNSHIRLYAGLTNTDTQTIYKIKLERGAVATDWTPAPEDTLGKVSKSGDTMSGSLSIATNTWGKIRFPNPDGGGYWRLEFNPNSNERRFNFVFTANDGSTNYVRCRTVTASNETLLFESDLNARLGSFGGRNLIKNSNTTNWVKWSSTQTERVTQSTHRGDKLIRVDIPAATGAFGVVTPENERTISIIEGKTYTLSFYGQSTLSRLNYVCLISASKGNKILPYANIDATLGTKYSLTFTAPYTAGDVGILIGVNGDFTAGGRWFSFLPPKLEEGSVATDWTPAPEDLATKATTLADYGIEDFVVRNLTANENLNDIKVPGLYFEGVSANATADRNYPEAQAGTLEVIYRGGVIQRYTALHSQHTYVRKYDTVNKVYGGWNRIDGIDNLPLSGGTVTGPTTFNAGVTVHPYQFLDVRQIRTQTSDYLNYHAVNRHNFYSANNNNLLTISPRQAIFWSPVSVNNTMFVSSLGGVSSDDYTTATNVDGFWHDDATDTWYFQSDAPYRSKTGLKSTVKAKDFQTERGASLNELLARIRVLESKVL